MDQLVDRLRACLGLGDARRHAILFYHSVIDEKREKFARQMDIVKRYATAIALNDCDHAIRSAISITFDDGIENVYTNAVPELAARGIPFTIFVTSGYLGRHVDWIKNKAEYREERLMSAEQLKEISSMDLAEIGSHSVNHKELTAIRNVDAQREISESKQELENLLNIEISAFSYPYGKYNQAHITYAKEAGYVRTYSIEPKMASSEKYVIGRFGVSLDDWDMEFILKISGSYRWLMTAARVQSFFKI
jgi:peptidoglycan/xylan/chitin deacetylase (PgdA/CDA1 family)